MVVGFTLGHYQTSVQAKLIDFGHTQNDLYLNSRDRDLKKIILHLLNP